MSEIEAFFDDADVDYDDEMSEDNSSESTKKKSKFLIAIAALVALLGIVVAALGIWIFSAIDSMHKLGFNMDDAHSGTEMQSQSGINFLLLGSDSRISNGDISWTKGAQRSDVMMLVQISKDGKHMTVMSIPRDTAVVIPGHEDEGETKLNSAFSYGGIPLLVQTLEKNTGIRIDHVAVMDFQSFVGLTDTVGGVTLTSEAEGTKEYNGKEALAFVRERKHLPRGDFDRVRRQQAWMAAVIDKVLTREVLESPSKFKDVYDSLIPYVALDDSVGVKEAYTLAQSLRTIKKSDIQFTTVPITDSGLKNGNWLTHFDPEYFKPLCEAWQKGEAWKYIDENSEAFDRLGSRPVA